MLELPRELYLMICEYLKPTTDLTRLAGVCKDHYLAVQQPRYREVNITSYRSLIELVQTLQKVPVVSHISPHQRRTWFTLSDAQLSERDIKHLNIVLDERKEGTKILGVILSNFIGAVSRKCYAVKITLSLRVVGAALVKQLEASEVPNVTKLKLLLGSCHPSRCYSGEHSAWSDQVWDFVFSGSTFPDLESVYLDTSSDHQDLRNLEANNPGSLEYATQHENFLSGEHINKPRAATPFYGLRSMKQIIFQRMRYLDALALESIFASDVIPKRLTRLEIVECSSLHPVRDLMELSAVLQKALPLVQTLKLHLHELDVYYDDADEEMVEYESEYTSRINEHPEDHLCNIIRELGQNIRSLDIAVPFACSRMFLAPEKNPQINATTQQLPSIPLHPRDRLQERVLAEGYKYRKLTCWHGVCRKAHDWEKMSSLANGQTGNHSWLLLYPDKYSGSWHLSGYSPVKFIPNESSTERTSEVSVLQ